jgi:ABC-type antimicrobial peptide transport system permease subunit
MILIEAAALALPAAFGLLLGWGALQVLTLIPQTAMSGFTSIRFAQGAETLAIAMSIGLASGFMPDWRGARLSPVEALRYE